VTHFIIEANLRGPRITNLAGSGRPRRASISNSNRVAVLTAVPFSRRIFGRYACWAGGEVGERASVMNGAPRPLELEQEEPLRVWPYSARLEPPPARRPRRWSDSRQRFGSCGPPRPFCSAFLPFHHARAGVDR